MKLINENQSNGKTEMLPPTTSVLSKYSMPNAHTTYIAGPFGELLEQEIITRDCVVHSQHFQIRTPVKLGFRDNEDTIALSYMIKGDLTCYQEGKIYAMHRSGYYHLRYNPAQTVFEAAFEPGLHVCITFNCTSFYFQELAADYPQLDLFLQKIRERKNIGRVLPSQKTDTRSARVLKEILHYRKDGTERRIFLKARFYDLLLLHIENAYGSLPAKTGTQDNALILSYADYIQGHLNEKITLQAIAKQHSVSLPVLKQNFQSHFQKPFREYLLEARMKRAAQLLAAGMHVKEIFRHTGYADHSSFYRAFKNFHGTTPAKMLKEK